jgi:hypothetical protein
MQNWEEENSPDYLSADHWFRSNSKLNKTQDVIAF